MGREYHPYEPGPGTGSDNRAQSQRERLRNSDDTWGYDTPRHDGSTLPDMDAQEEGMRVYMGLPEGSRFDRAEGVWSCPTDPGLISQGGQRLRRRRRPRLSRRTRMRTTVQISQHPPRTRLPRNLQTPMPEAPPLTFVACFPAFC